MYLYENLLKMKISNNISENTLKIIKDTKMAYLATGLEVKAETLDRADRGCHHQ